jgi:hypothetical protein
MKGHVYILVNSSIPNLIKIGRTAKEPRVRAQELSATGTPGRYIVAYSVHVDNCIEVEAEMHINFQNQRHTNDREFFEVETTSAINELIKISHNRKIQALSDIEGKEVNQFNSATFYLLKAGPNHIYRIGILNKPEDFINSSEFKEMTNDFYSYLDSGYSYNCELLKTIELKFIDLDALNQIIKLIDDNVSTSKFFNKSILKNAKFDARTFMLDVVNDAVLTFPKKLYESTYSLITPIAEASAQRKLNQDQLLVASSEALLLKDKLSRIDALKKMGL